MPFLASKARFAHTCCWRKSSKNVVNIIRLDKLKSISKNMTSRKTKTKHVWFNRKLNFRIIGNILIDIGLCHQAIFYQLPFQLAILLQKISLVDEKAGTLNHMHATRPLGNFYSPEYVSM